MTHLSFAHALWGWCLGWCEDSGLYYYNNSNGWCGYCQSCIFRDCNSWRADGICEGREYPLFGCWSCLWKFDGVRYLSDLQRPTKRQPVSGDEWIAGWCDGIQVFQLWKVHACWSCIWLEFADGCQIWIQNCFKNLIISHDCRHKDSCFHASFYSVRNSK